MQVPGSPWDLPCDCYTGKVFPAFWVGWGLQENYFYDLRPFTKKEKSFGGLVQAQGKLANGFMLSAFSAELLGTLWFLVCMASYLILCQAMANGFGWKCSKAACGESQQKSSWTSEWFQRASLGWYTLNFAFTIGGAQFLNCLRLRWRSVSREVTEAPMSRFKIRPQLGVEAQTGITLWELRQEEYHKLDAILGYGEKNQRLHLRYVYKFLSTHNCVIILLGTLGVLNKNHVLVRTPSLL